MLRTRPYTGQG